MSRRARDLTLCALLLGAACRQDMHDQPRYEPFEACSFFEDGRSERPQVAGTLARDEPWDDDYLVSGRIDGKLVDAFPFPTTRSILERGRQRFEIQCAPCHARDGSGDGLVVKRGMRRPESFHAQRLQQAPAGYFFDVMTRGFGAMFDVADVVPPDDRWAIAAYIRALQRSQSAHLADVPPDERARLEAR